MRNICIVDGCSVFCTAKGLCQKHYDLMRRPRKGRFKGTDEERFWKLVDKESEKYTGNCWVWIASCFKVGYGQFHSRRTGRNYKAHRFAYEIVKGPIPDGLVIDHLCRNKKCVNPDHLEAVTQDENIRRVPKQLLCGRGHLRVPGTRRCSLCSTKYRPGRSPERRREEYLRRKQRAEGLP